MRTGYDIIKERIKIWLAGNAMTETGTWLVRLQVENFSFTSILWIEPDGTFVWDSDWWEFEDTVRLIGIVRADDVEVKEIPRYDSF